MSRSILKLTLLIAYIIPSLSLTSCQKADDIEEEFFVLSIQDDTIYIPAEGGEMNVEIQTNAETWTTLSNAEWLGVATYGKTLVIECTPNPDVKDRTAEISIQAGTKKIVLNVRQLVLKRNTPQRFIPVLDWGTTLEAVTQTEDARQSTLMAHPQLPSSNSVAQPYYIFRTGSTLFPEVRYDFEAWSGQNLCTSVLLCRDNSILQTEAFTDYLKALDAVQVARVGSATIGYTTYHSPKYRSLITVVEERKEHRARLEFIPDIPEKNPSPTFPSFPYPLLSFGATIEDIARYEEMNGGVEDPEFSQMFKFPFYHAPRPAYVHIYLIDKSKRTLNQPLLLFDELSYGMYRFGDRFLLTQELKELLRKEGFEFMHHNLAEDYYRYSHKDKNLQLIISHMNWAESERLRFLFLSTK